MKFDIFCRLNPQLLNRQSVHPAGAGCILPLAGMPNLGGSIVKSQSFSKFLEWSSPCADSWNLRSFIKIFIESHFYRISISTYIQLCRNSQHISQTCLNCQPPGFPNKSSNHFNHQVSRGRHLHPWPDDENFMPWHTWENKRMDLRWHVKGLKYHNGKYNDINIYI